jgi:hypothetical protein
MKNLLFGYSLSMIFVMGCLDPSASTRGNTPEETSTSVSPLSSVGGSISQSEILNRAQYWVNQGYIYSPNAPSAYTFSDDATGESYRNDCSGLVSDAWHLSTSYVTSDFNVDNSLWHTIAWDSMQSGDAYVRHDSSVEHIELFAFWDDSSDHSKGFEKYSFNTNNYTVENPYALNNVGKSGHRSYAQDGFHAIHYIRAVPNARASSVYAIGAGVTSGIDLLVASSTGTAFNPLGNGLHADGYGWSGLKVVAGDFNGDGLMDIGAIGAGVDGHSVDLLVALANASGGFAPMSNWRHADGFGWNGMKPIAGDFNGDGRWDIGAIGAGVDGHSIDLLVATSTGSGFTPIGNWRHADGFGWNGMKPIAGDFNGDGRWDIGAIGAGVDGHSIDLLVATSTGSGFNLIGNWRHADGFGWNGLAPASL